MSTKPTAAFTATHTAFLRLLPLVDCNPALQMLEDDPEMTMESVAAFEAAADADADMEVDLSSAMPAGFMGALVSGTVGCRCQICKRHWRPGGRAYP